jgi:ribosome biogenesis protein MAK21
MRTIMNKGTVIDRVAAHTIAIQDSPIHTLSLLQNLVSMMKVNKKKECTMVLGKNQLVLRHKANSALSKCVI